MLVPRTKDKKKTITNKFNSKRLEEFDMKEKSGTKKIVNSNRWREENRAGNPYEPKNQLITQTKLKLIVNVVSSTKYVG